MSEANLNETTKRVDDRTARQRKVAELVQEAMKQPGVSAMMKVYGQWQQLDERMRTSERASRPTQRIVLSNRSVPALP